MINKVFFYNDFLGFSLLIYFDIPTEISQLIDLRLIYLTKIDSIKGMVNLPDLYINNNHIDDVSVVNSMNITCKCKCKSTKNQKLIQLTINSLIVIHTADGIRKSV